MKKKNIVSGVQDGKTKRNAVLEQFQHYNSLSLTVNYITILIFSLWAALSLSVYCFQRYRNSAETNAKKKEIQHRWQFQDGL